ncbi:MAG: metallophosphoesterase family protein [Acidimicrobiales bacterium]
MKIFFATDIHGSEICWKKFLNAAAFYKADVVILGGDLTGKVMVPIVSHPGYWEVVVSGETRRLESDGEVAAVETQIRNRGYYPTRVTGDELADLQQEEGSVDRRFTAEMVQTLDRWLDMADSKLRGGVIPCILNGGNDDTLEIDPILEQSPCVSFAEGKSLDVEGFSLVSMGYTNPTPWNTFRESPEPELAARIKEAVDQVPDMSRAIFNFHAPPYSSGLDEAPALDENMRPLHGGAVMRPVGSTAVHDAIMAHQPLLSVHGHIHEGRGIAKLGRTLTINPGSSYADGVLQGAVIDLDTKKKKVSRYLLVNG